MWKVNEPWFFLRAKPQGPQEMQLKCNLAQSRRDAEKSLKKYKRPQFAGGTGLARFFLSIRQGSQRNAKMNCIAPRFRDAKK